MWHQQAHTGPSFFLLSFHLFHSCAGSAIFSPILLPFPFHLSLRCSDDGVFVLTEVPPATAHPKYWQPNLISLLPLSLPPSFSPPTTVLSPYPPSSFQVSDVILSCEPRTTFHLARWASQSLPLSLCVVISASVSSSLSPPHMLLGVAAKMLRHCACFIWTQLLFQTSNRKKQMFFSCFTSFSFWATLSCWGIVCVCVPEFVKVLFLWWIQQSVKV